MRPRALAVWARIQSRWGRERPQTPARSARIQSRWGRERPQTPARCARLLAAGLLLGLGLAGLGCAQQSSTEDEPPARLPAAAQEACSCDERPVVDPTLLAFLSMARAAHHEADLAVEAGDRGAAIAALERVAKSAWPGRKPPEVLEVTADTLARLADLKSEDGRFDEAARDVSDGIGIATEPTHFRGRLFEVRGLVEERRSRALKEKGDTAGADRARKAAMESFGQAMDIQEDVIGRALKDKEKGDR